MRVWSLASMELVIQFQVLNQVGGEFWGVSVCSKQSPGHVLCSHGLKRVPCHLPGENADFPHHGTLELSLPCVDPPILRTPRAAAGGGRLQ